MREKFNKAISELMNKKALGVNPIPAKNCRKNTKKIIYELIQKIYETGQVTRDFIKCIIIPIPNKTTEKTCDQHRT